MQQSANETVYKAAPPEIRTKIAALLAFLSEQSMSCRVEVTGHELIVIVGTGLPPASYWINRLRAY